MLTAAKAAGLAAVLSGDDLMGSVAVDCQPMRDTNVVIPHIGHVSSPEPVGSPTSCQRTPNGRKFAYSNPIYAAEVVNRSGRRKITTKHAKSTWEDFTILDYELASGKHRIRWDKPKDRPDEWLYLADLRFKWTEVQGPGAAPNPNYKPSPEFCRERAVNRKLKVYWPLMGRWYQGQVKAYNPHTDEHTIWYHDGDAQTFVLKHEPVIWLDDDDKQLFNGKENGVSDQQLRSPVHSFPYAGNGSISGAVSPTSATAAIAAAGFSAGTGKKAISFVSTSMGDCGGATASEQSLLQDGIAEPAAPTIVRQGPQQQQQDVDMQDARVPEAK